MTLNEKFTWLVSQRRFWVGVLSVAAFTCTFYGFAYGAGVSSIIAGIAGIDSLVRPKKV